jgi:hypothetical protein
MRRLRSARTTYMLMEYIVCICCFKFVTLHRKKFLSDGKWEAEDDPSSGSADKIKPISRKYDGRYTYIVFTSALLQAKSVLRMLRHKTFNESAKPRKLTRRTETRTDLANKLAGFFSRITYEIRDEWVPVTMEWRVFRLRMEERPPVWRVAANILNKQSRTANKG